MIVRRVQALTKELVPRGRAQVRQLVNLLLAKGTKARETGGETSESTGGTQCMPKFCSGYVHLGVHFGITGLCINT